MCTSTTNIPIQSNMNQQNGALNSMLRGVANNGLFSIPMATYSNPAYNNFMKSISQNANEKLNRNSFYWFHNRNGQTQRNFTSERISPNSNGFFFGEKDQSSWWPMQNGQTV